MASKWFIAAPGIRDRKHVIRKHGGAVRSLLQLRYSVSGRQVEEPLGWAFKGWTIEKAKDEPARLRNAKRTGCGPKTLREEREAQERTERGTAELRSGQSARRPRPRQLPAMFVPDNSGRIPARGRIHRVRALRVPRSHRQ
jgi:hypothetical protein